VGETHEGVTGNTMRDVFAIHSGVSVGPNVVEAPGRAEGRREPRVTVVRRGDCSHGVQAIAAIKRLADELRIPIQVEEVLVRTDEEARASGCLGSPTVLLGGKDVEPDARGRTSFGVT
jgi:hypothetical protein